MKPNIKNIIYLALAAIVTYILYMWMRKKKTEAAQAVVAQVASDQQVANAMITDKRVIAKGNKDGQVFLFDLDKPIELNGENRVAELNQPGTYIGYATGQRIFVGGFPFIMISRIGYPMFNGRYYVSENMVTLE
jgi:hypothetical protein